MSFQHFCISRVRYSQEDHDELLRERRAAAKKAKRREKTKRARERKRREREEEEARAAEEERNFRETAARVRQELRSRQLRERHELEARQLRELQELEACTLDENLALESRNARERLERLQEAQRNREHRLRERRAAKRRTATERRERAEERRREEQAEDRARTKRARAATEGRVAAMQEDALHGTRAAIANTEAIFNGDCPVAAHALSEVRGGTRGRGGCPDCHAMLWKGEDKRKAMCCRDGASTTINIQPVPPEGSNRRVINDLLMDDGDDGKVLRKFSIASNNAFAFTSQTMQAKEVPGGGWKPTVVIQGGCYHQIGPIVPQEGSTGYRNIQIYTLDEQHEDDPTSIRIGNVKFKSGSITVAEKEM